MGWRVIYIEESERLSSYLDNLKVTNGDHETLIPLADIHSIIIDNYKLVLSVQLLNKCAENNINVITCGIDHNPAALVIPHAGHHRMVAMMRKQLQWEEDKKKIAHREIVKSKIFNQIFILKQCGIAQNEYSLLEQYYSQVELSDATNREGLAAKVYFRLMYGKQFQRFDDTVLNAGLNYGYSILRSQINKVVLSKGLNSALGVIHIGPSNAFNLSDDVIEPFRPLVDLWVYNNLRFADEFTKDHRQALVKLTTTKVTIANQNHTLFNAIVMMVESIIDFFDSKKEIVFPLLHHQDIDDL